MIPAWSVDSMPEAEWRDRVVIIGATAQTLGDQLETPFGQQSGSEVLGSAIAGLINGRGFRPLGFGALVALFAAWLLLCHWRIAASSTALKTVTSIAVLALLSLGITVASWCLGIWLPGAAFLLVPVVGGSLLAAEQFRVETFQRRFLHSVLSRRVSPNLMRNMLRSGADVWTQLGGQRVRCVVLFTDLIGFTARSSAMEPEHLFTLLNRYFEVMAAPVLAEQGLLDKFIGDSVMAEFGVPQHRGDREEALAAVRTALAMQRNLHQLNKELAEEGQEPLRHGIGIHCGDVVAGNLGSSQRLEYTVIGGSVNVASRLESLTRLFPQHSILISREVLDLLSENVRVEALGSHAVKGWPDPIEVFSLIDLVS
jgi:adenylate cyclase